MLFAMIVIASPSSFKRITSSWISFPVSHGKAVAIGMAMIARSLCTQDTAEEIIEILKDFGLPCRTCETADALYRTALSDKKRTGATVHLIVPTKIGECVIRPTPAEELKSIIKAGL